MTNIERQKSLEKSNKGCGTEFYCKFCQHEKETPCARAYNRMIYNFRKQGNEREKYSWGD